MPETHPSRTARLLRPLVAVLALLVLSPFGMAGAPGLRVANGGFTLDGRPLRAIGVNYFDAFSRVLEDETRADSYRAGFRKLKQHSIPFIRFNCGGFYPVDWTLYRTDPARYFQLLDRFVADAEENGIGLIPSLFWAYFTVPGLSGETLDAWGDEGSRTHAFMKRYVADVVGRYRHSPALWAWEFGNEYNLAVDLPGGAENHKRWFHPSRGMPEKPQPRDAITSAHVRTALKAFGEAVREIDPARPLISGHAMPRSAAAHLEKEGSWKPDTEAAWTDAFLRNQPPPLDTTCVHYYPFHPDESSGVAGKSHRENLQLCRQAGATRGTPLFVGEFGPAAGTDPATRLRQTGAMLDEMVALRIPLSAVWVFDFPHQDVTIPADASGDEILELIRQANERLK